MAATDYTTLVNVKAYGNISAGADDALIAGLITAFSAQIDNYCQQSFYQQTVTNATYKAWVDKDGLLAFYPPVSQINSITAAAFRQRGVLTWTGLDTTQFDIANATNGCVVRAISPDFTRYRAANIQVQVSYTAGFAVANLPADLELAARRLTWWGYKQRSAPMEKTAIPEMGVLIVPQAWPPDIKQVLGSFKNWNMR